MSVSARGILASTGAMARHVRPIGGTQVARSEFQAKARPEKDIVPAESRPNVFVAANNRLVRETLTHMLRKKGNVEVVGMEPLSPFNAECVSEAGANVLLLSSTGTLNEDLLLVQKVRGAAPKVRILLLGMARSEAEFLRCVRVGISGYLLHDASADEVLAGVRAVHAGEAVCPGMLCTALFRYFESEAAALPCASARRRLGLTRREQQLVPLIAKGLTNKEIARHFSLSEQTVKNHLYRMKHKTGAEDRLDIVQLYRVEGFLV
jgi:DNA-binding NarL/FixJ family response regulator